MFFFVSHMVVLDHNKHDFLTQDTSIVVLSFYQKEMTVVRNNDSDDRFGSTRVGPLAIWSISTRHGYHGGDRGTKVGPVSFYQ